MKQYIDLLNKVLYGGTIKDPARAGMPITKGIFGHQMKFDLQEGFPLLTTKKMPFKTIAHELIWFLRGDTNIKYLVDNGVHIWDKDAYRHFCKLFPDVAPHKTIEQFIGDVKEGVIFGSVGAIPRYTAGDLGEVYGAQWRNWNNDGIDQISKVIQSIKTNPFGRRHIVSAWNPSEVDDMALPPCHCMFQFNCRPIPLEHRFELFKKLNIEAQVNLTQLGHETFDELGVPKFYLDNMLTMRSVDTFLGLPFNIASYALLTEVIAKMCGMIAGNFVWSAGDVHIYENHESAVKEQLKCEPMALPKIKIGDRVETFRDISSLEINDMMLMDYNSHPAIKGELSVGT